MRGQFARVSCCFKLGGWYCSYGQGPIALFQVFHDFQMLSNHQNTKCHLPGLQKNSKLCKVEDKFKRNSSPFGKKFKFANKFELKI
jgi:hypothetical protein